MSASTLLTQGFGSFGSPASIVTNGMLSGGPASNDDNCVITVSNFHWYKATVQFFKGRGMITAIRRAQQYNRIISYCEFKEWNVVTEEYDLFDPTSGPYCVVEDPDDVEYSYTYGGLGGEIVKLSTGKYYILVDVDDAGDWFISWYTSGDEKAFEEQHLLVQEVQTTP